MRWEIPGPWPSIEEVVRRFDELIRTRWGQTVEPPADIVVMEDQILIEIDLPGVEESDVRASIEGTVFIVEAHREVAVPVRGARAARIERSRGILRRAFPLPLEFTRARMTVELRHGVLHVRLEREQRR